MRLQQNGSKKSISFLRVKPGTITCNGAASDSIQEEAAHSFQLMDW
jgi:hypothetical protein